MRTPVDRLSLRQAQEEVGQLRETLEDARALLRQLHGVYWTTPTPEKRELWAKVRAFLVGNCTCGVGNFGVAYHAGGCGWAGEV